MSVKVLPMTAVDTRMPSVADVRRAFDQPSALTVGIEEEVLLLDPVTLDLLPRAVDVVARAGNDPMVKLEMPASQIELVTQPATTVAEAAGALLAARRRVRASAEGLGVIASAAVHPRAASSGVLNTGQRYASCEAEYGWVARRQLVSGLHVHVALGPAEVAMQVYNAMRDHLPDLAALAAGAPFLEGCDTGLASVRPKISENLPRQGIPPPFDGIEDLVAAWSWTARAGALQDVRQWWWELRLHPAFGTLEVRVCDAQPTVAATAALAATIQSLCGVLADRALLGTLPPPTPSWKIEANRWSACRHGVHGTMADPETGAPVPTRDRLSRLLEALHPTARRLGCDAELGLAWQMLANPTADQHRAVAGATGTRGLCAWLVDRFADPFA